MADIPTSLAVAAITIGFVHTIAGPDHYLPFVAISRARNWTLRKTLCVTLICGLGHVLSSVVLGSLGIAFGLGIDLLESVESKRGELASWLLIGFGLAYCLWGIRRAARNRPHSHVHVHADGSVHEHLHTHDSSHAHVHDTPDTGTSEDEGGKKASFVPWALFVIFLFGPCEALIPMLMLPAAEASLGGIIWVTALFGVTTLITMTAIVAAATCGVRAIASTALEAHAHAIAGLIVLSCGLAVRFGL